MIWRCSCDVDVGADVNFEDVVRHLCHSSDHQFFLDELVIIDPGQRAFGSNWSDSSPECVTISPNFSESIKLRTKLLSHSIIFGLWPTLPGTVRLISSWKWYESEHTNNKDWDKSIEIRFSKLESNPTTGWTSYLANQSITWSKGGSKSQ